MVQPGSWLLILKVISPSNLFLSFLINTFTTWHNKLITSSSNFGLASSSFALFIRKITTIKLILSEIIFKCPKMTFYDSLNDSSYVKRKHHDLCRFWPLSLSHLNSNHYDIHHVSKAWYYKNSFQAGGKNRIRKFSDLHSINIDKKPT